MKEARAVRLSHATGVLRGTVQLPASKSESNRALLINALAGGGSALHNLSEAHDTVLMQRLLHSNAPTIDAEDAGTVMRFLTAYFAITDQERVLTGSKRMCERPIGVLVEALRELEADIEYLGKEGYPPLQINGIDLSWPAQTLSIPGHLSSQYISALLMIAPLLPLGLTLNLTGKVVSRPYIRLTLALMAHFGAAFTWEGNTIQVLPQPYHPVSYTVEPDWSAAGYWYSMVALARDAEVYLPGLRADSFQGDRALATLMQPFGVRTLFDEQGALLVKDPRHPIPPVLDLADTPDLAQTVLVLAAATRQPLQATGLETLRLKETDRISALQQELEKAGAALLEHPNQVFELFPMKSRAGGEEQTLEISTYQDHRMAMAFAPLALKQQVIIEEPGVVQKSYPHFWQDLQQAGFTVEFL